MELDIKTAIVLSDEKGKKMRGTHAVVSKHLLSVAGKLPIHYWFDRFNEIGITNHIVSLQHFAAPITEHINFLLQTTHKHINVNFLVHEPNLRFQNRLLKNIEEFADDDKVFIVVSDRLVLNGVFPILQVMKQNWNDDQMDFLVLAVSKYNNTDFDTGLTIDTHGVVHEREERTMSPFSFGDVLIAKVGVLRKILNEDTDNKMQRLSDIIYKYCETDRVSAVVHDGEWFKLNSIDALRRANDFMFKGIHYIRTIR